MSDIQNFSGFITPVASTTGKCGLVVTPGAEPTVPEPGGVWYDIGDDAFALFSVDGTITYLPKGNGLTGQIVRSNGTTSVPTFQTLLLSKGAWSGGTAYIANDIVTDTGSAYICILAHTNHQPPNGTYWALLVANGATGAAGAAGPGILALQGVNSIGISGPFTSGVELQVANPFANFPSAVLNGVNRIMLTRFHGHFITSGGETPTLDLVLEMSTIDIATITTGALTAGVGAGKFVLSFETIALNTGATAILQTTGTLEIQLDGTLYTTYRLGPVTTSANIDLTGTGKPKLNATCHGTALTSITIDDAFAQFLPSTIP